MFKIIDDDGIIHEAYGAFIDSDGDMQFILCSQNGSLYATNTYPNRYKLYKKNDTELFWISAIVYDDDDKKPWLCAISDAELSLESAKEQIKHLKDKHNLLSAWIDTFDENNVRQTVFHRFYVR